MAESGGRVLGRARESPPHQLEGMWSAVSSPSGRSSGKFGFWNILGPQKSRQNGQLAFESEGATRESTQVANLSTVSK